MAENTEAIEFSSIAISSFKSTFKRVLNDQDKFSIIQFINSENVRRPIIGFFSNRSLSNLSDYLNENPKIRSFILDYSEMFYFKLHEKNLNNLHFSTNGGKSKFTDVISVQDNFLLFLTITLGINRAPLENALTGVLLGKELTSSYYQNPVEIMEFLKVNAWVMAYYILFMNSDSLEDYFNDVIKAINES